MPLRILADKLLCLRGLKYGRAQPQNLDFALLVVYSPKCSLSGTLCLGCVLLAIEVCVH